MNEKIEVIQKEITKLKLTVKEFMTDKYVEFSPSLRTDQTLVNKSEKLSEDMKVLQKRVEDQVTHRVQKYCVACFSKSALSTCYCLYSL